MDRYSITMERLKMAIPWNASSIWNEDSIWVDRSELLCHQLLLKYERDRESCWLRLEAGCTPCWALARYSTGIGKDSDAGRDWGQQEKGTTEDEMAGWHHQLDGHEFEWTPGDGDGQTGRPGVLQFMGRKESDTTERLNWTELDQRCTGDSPFLEEAEVASMCAHMPRVNLVPRAALSCPTAWGAEEAGLQEDWGRHRSRDGRREGNMPEALLALHSLPLPPSET